jgi:hypothetical protein
MLNELPIRRCSILGQCHEAYTVAARDFCLSVGPILHSAPFANAPALGIVSFAGL